MSICPSEIYIFSPPGPLILTDPESIAQDYQLPEVPTHAILAHISHAEVTYGGNIEGGARTELTTYNSVPFIDSGLVGMTYYAR